MKLIIDIPEEVYKAYCVSGYCIDDAIILDNAIIKARPLDDVRAEILKRVDEHCARTLEIFGNIGKAESEGKE